MYIHMTFDLHKKRMNNFNNLGLVRFTEKGSFCVTSLFVFVCIRLHISLHTAVCVVTQLKEIIAHTQVILNQL